MKGFAKMQSGYFAKISTVWLETLSLLMPSPVDIRLTFGQILIGVILGSLFYGIVLLQAGLYFGGTGRNRVRHNVLVTILVFLETFAWILEVYCVWWYFVLNYANPAALRKLNWFFIEKIWILGKSYFLGAFLTFLALSGWGTGIAIGVLNFVQRTTHSPAIERINYYEKASETLVELHIAICMIYLLRRMRTGIKKSDQILNNLVVFMLTRGIVVCVVQVVYTSTSFNTTVVGNLIWVTPHFCIGKFATNAVLASLNVRELVQAGFSRKCHAMSTPDDAIAISIGPSATRPIVSMEPIAFGQMRSVTSTQSGLEQGMSTKSTERPMSAHHGPDANAA
ncbi:hypothetical protein K488DRAFT_85335 [Vararia minispora EC-137]|uniref:Uncharacterized protein n=1 Tax=Vararia minispora EC-137 TaxID=1314806 RepID=A0ACB8QMT0_9AGAM|nr:hypothetical protein K488DRAFT_85335 [Vararia minispora EC-137]